MINQNKILIKRKYIKLKKLAQFLKKKCAVNKKSSNNNEINNILYNEFMFSK